MKMVYGPRSRIKETEIQIKRILSDQGGKTAEEIKKVLGKAPFPSSYPSAKKALCNLKRRHENLFVDYKISVNRLGWLFIRHVFFE